MPRGGGRVAVAQDGERSRRLASCDRQDRAMPPKSSPAHGSASSARRGINSRPTRRLPPLTESTTRPFASGSPSGVSPSCARGGRVYVRRAALIVLLDAQSEAAASGPVAGGTHDAPAQSRTRPPQGYVMTMSSTGRDVVSSDRSSIWPRSGGGPATSEPIGDFARRQPASRLGQRRTSRSHQGTRGGS